MPYPLCVCRAKAITYQMRSNVIQRMTPAVDTFYTRAEKFGICGCWMYLGKWQKLFNPVLIRFAYARCCNPSSVHAQCCVIQSTIKGGRTTTTYYEIRSCNSFFAITTFLSQMNKQTRKFNKWRKGLRIRMCKQMFGLKGKEHGREEWTYYTGMWSIASTWYQMKRREGRGKFKPKRRKRGNGSTIFRFHNGLESEYFF